MPASTGRVGAPYRSTQRKTASGPMPIRGMNVMQIIMFLPTSRVPHCTSGTTKSSRTTATATSSGAKLLGWEKDVGALAAGHYADVVAVRGDPTIDIKLLHQMLFVMKNGVVYKGVPGIQQ